VLNRIRQTTAGYPRQFWLLFWGQLMNSIGSSMVWPFLTIYARERLGVPLTTVTLLVSLNAASGLVATTIVGPFVDRFGRKLAMVLSLAMTSVAFILMSTASTLPVWMALMVLMGMFGPLYQVGSNAMIADLIAPERRAGGYALLRMIANVGVAIGPVIGGVLVTISYGLTFSLAAAAGTAFALLIALFVAETLPQRAKLAGQPQISGYSPVLRDRLFLAFCGIYTLSCMVYSLMMVLLPVYGKENFGLAESQYGPILATNAAMVVLFQFAVTRMTERYRPVPVLALGTLFYALGVGSVGAGLELPHLPAQHGDSDDRRDDRDPHIYGVYGQPGACGDARPLHERAGPDLAGGFRDRAGAGRLPQRSRGAGGDLVRRVSDRAGGGAELYAPGVAAAAPRQAGQATLRWDGGGRSGGRVGTGRRGDRTGRRERLTIRE